MISFASSHEDTSIDETGRTVALGVGMFVTAFDEGADEHGTRDDVVASGTVERSPDWLLCAGSKWVLRIDRNGLCHQSILERAARTVDRVTTAGDVEMVPPTTRATNKP